MSAHAVMPVSTHDEAARFGYVVALKQYLMQDVEAPLRQFVDERLAPQLGVERSRYEFRKVEKAMRDVSAYRNWQAMTVIAQEQMWDSVADCVDRQLPSIQERIDTALPGGTLRTDDAFQPPRYLTAVDIHLMPGGYAADRGGTDIRQGAVFDKAAALYHMGRNGGELNDVRGHTIVQHLWDRFGPVRPLRILDLGCTVGHSTVAIASYFPDAEVHAVDVGGALLRYARGRAAALGQKIHFSQQSAESTDFPDSCFDLVVSSAVLHETSNKALPRIMRECHRLLRPGGHVIHLEVPLRFELESTWARIRGYFESVYNNEPFWIAAQSADVAGELRAAGFADATSGYQPAVRAADVKLRGQFRQEPGPAHRFWYMVSGTR